MINWTKTMMVWSVGRPVVAAQVALIQEGMAAVSGLDGGLMKIQPSNGSTSGIASRLEGIFMSPRRTFANDLTSTTVVAPQGGGTVLLPNTVNSAIGAFEAGVGTKIAVSTGGASPTNIQSATDATTGLTSLTFDPSLAGITFNVYYQFAMAPIVEQQLFGNGSPGFFNTDILSQSAIFKIGKIAVNNFDPAANWYDGTNDPGVKVIAGGLFTDSGNAAAGFIPPNVDIIEFPTPAFPWLSLEIH